MLQLRLQIDARAAILAGKTTLGVVTLNITDHALAALPPAERLELALAYEAQEPIGGATESLTEASLDALRPILQRRAQQRGLTNPALAGPAATPTPDLHETQRLAALRTWMLANGDPEQRLRAQENLISEDECLAEVAAALLPLPGFPRYEKILRGEACDCGCGGNVKFTVGPPQYLDAYQYEKLTKARGIKPPEAQLDVIEHRAHCAACKCPPLGRYELRLTLAWQGWLLVRQYRLT